MEPSQSELKPFVMSAVGSVLAGDEEHSAFPNSPEPLKASWNAKIVKEYFNPEAMGAKNRGWKKVEEIETRMTQIRYRTAFEDAKSVRESKIKRTISTKEYDMLPDDLSRLHQVALLNDGFKYTKAIWSIREDDGHEYLYKSKSKTTNMPNDFHKVIGMEHSYDFLMEIHLDLGHVGSTGLLDYLNVNKLGCLPRKLVQSFHRFCPHCTKKQHQKDVLKLSQHKEKKMDVIEFGLLIIATATINCKDVLKGEKTILFALYRRTSYVICLPLEDNFDISSLGETLMRGLMHSGIPRNMYLHEFNTKEKEKVRLYEQIVNLFNQIQNLIEFDQIANLFNQIQNLIDHF